MKCGSKRSALPLWRKKSKALSSLSLALFELKRPHIPAEDIVLLNKAAGKAVQLGAKFIVTWNVNDELLLWFPEFDTLPLYWQRWKWHIANIADLSQYPFIKPAL